ELVRRSGDEPLARGLQLRELLLHLVERDRELSELIGGVDRDRLLEVPRRDLLGRELQALDALGERPGDEIAANQREQKRDPARDQDLMLDDRHAADDV